MCPPFSSGRGVSELNGLGVAGELLVGFSFFTVLDLVLRG